MGVYNYDAINDELVPIAGTSAEQGLSDKVSKYSADSTYWDTTPTSSSTKPVTSGGIYTSLTNKVDWESNGNLGAKNFLENEEITQTISGVTFTINSDGSVVANGTATDLIWFQINKGFKLKNLEYTLTGCPSGGGENTYELQIRSTESSSSLWQFLVDRGNGATALCSSSRTYISFIGIKSGVTVTNLLFKPMLRLASDTDDTYQSYAMTNKQLTNKKVHWDDYSQLGAVNIFDFTIATQTAKGITFTQNNDGTVTVSGSNTQGSGIGILTKIQRLKKGTYILSGCPSITNGVLSLQLSDEPVSIGIIAEAKNGQEVAFTLASDTDIKVQYYANSTASITGSVTIKPMICPISYNGDYVPYAKTNKELTDAVTTSSNILTVLTEDSTWYYPSATANGNAISFNGFITLSRDATTNENSWINIGQTSVKPKIDQQIVSGRLGGTGSVIISSFILRQNGYVQFNMREGMKTGDQFTIMGAGVI